MKCDDCGGPAKPLFTGKYCVLDCAREELKDDLGMLDLWDEDTKPGVYPLYAPCPPCAHLDKYYGSNGNVTGSWCRDCGRLLSTP